MKNNIYQDTTIAKQSYQSDKVKIKNTKDNRSHPGGELMGKSIIEKVFFIHSHSDKEVCGKTLSFLPNFVEELKSFINNKTCLRPGSVSKKNDTYTKYNNMINSDSLKVSELIKIYDNKTKKDNKIGNNQYNKVNDNYDIKIEDKVMDNTKHEINTEKTIVKDLITIFDTNIKCPTNNNNYNLKLSNQQDFKNLQLQLSYNRKLEFNSSSINNVFKYKEDFNNISGDTIYKNSLNNNIPPLSRSISFKDLMRKWSTNS